MTVTDTSVRLFEREDINHTIPVLDRLIHYLELEDEMAAMRWPNSSSFRRSSSQLLEDAIEERNRLLDLYKSCGPGPREMFRTEHPRLTDLGNSPYCGNPDCGGPHANRFVGSIDRHTHESMWGNFYPNLLPGPPPNVSS